MKRVVLITGVFGGIGYATATFFKRQDWIVVGMDRYHGEDRNKCIDIFMNLDCSEIENVKTVKDTITTEFGKLNCLVNNAAVQVCKSIDDTSEDEWDLVFKNNIRTNFLFIKHMHELLIKGQGSVVNVSSVHAFATSKDISAYAASKGAILAFTRSTALEFANDRIRVNTVLPGAINTNMLRAGLQREGFGNDSVEQRIENLGLKSPALRVGEPEEIAKVIYFLGDNDWSSFVTGQSLVADGGVLAQLSSET